MAVKKFLFMNATEGFVQEQGSLDELSVAKLTLTGIDGVALDVSNTKIVNLAAPSASTDAARKGYVDGEISTEATARANADTTLQTNITNEATARANADTTLQTNITNEATARANADTAITNAYIAADTVVTNAYIAADTVVLADAKSYADSIASGFYVKAPVKAVADYPVTLSGTQSVDGVSLVAGDRVLLVGQVDARDNGIYVVAAGAWARSPDANSDAEVKDGMSVFVEQGTSYDDTTWVLITNNVITLGTTYLYFQRFSGLGQISAGAGLVKSGDTLSVGQGNGIEVAASEVRVNLATLSGLQFSGGGLAANPDSTRALAKDASGLYVKADSAKALAIDATNGLQVKADSAKALAIDGTNGLQVKADSAKALAIDGTSGLQVVVDSAKALAIDGTNGLQVKADSNYGFSFDATAGLRLDLASRKGLEFSSGDLAVKLESDAGMEFDAVNGGLELKLVSADRLTKSSSGLDVVGLPLQFKVNGSATGTTVTASNLSALTGNYAYADNLHSHTKLKFNLIAGEDFATGKFVVIGTAGKGMLASCSAAPSARVVGVASTMGWTDGPVEVQFAGSVNFGYLESAMTAGTPYYLGPAGVPVAYSALGSGDRVIRLGYALGSYEMFLSIQDMGLKA